MLTTDITKDILKERGYTPRRIVITFHENVSKEQIDIFTKKYEQYNLKNERIISDYFNIWEFSYNDTKIDPAQFRELMDQEEIVDGFFHDTAIKHALFK